MNSLNSPLFSSYRNGEFLQFMKNAYTSIYTFDVVGLLIEERANELNATIQEMEAVFQPIMSSELTPELFALDVRRDKALMGIKTYLESQLYREEAERVLAAEKLKANYLSHGDRIDKLSYQQETAVVNALLNDWNSETSLQTAVSTLELSFWLSLLSDINNQFDTLYVQRSQQAVNPVQTDLKRAAMKTAYEDLTNDIIAYSRIASNTTPYKAIIQALNGLIDNYNLAVTQRLAGKSTDNEGSTTAPTGTV